jgi:hypothetical protein
MQIVRLPLMIDLGETFQSSDKFQEAATQQSDHGRINVLPHEIFVGLERLRLCAQSSKRDDNRLEASLE